MITTTVRINNRLYKQVLKRQGRYNLGRKGKEGSQTHKLYVDQIELNISLKQPYKDKIDR
jgi:hypothetical protein